MRYLEERRDYTSALQKECGDSRLHVYWDKQYNNFVIKHGSSLIYEFVTGQPFVLSRAKDVYHRMRTRKDLELIEENRKRVEENKAKDELEMQEHGREVAADMVKYGTHPFKITNRRGDREIVVNPRGSKNFHYRDKSFQQRRANK